MKKGRKLANDAGQLISKRQKLKKAPRLMRKPKTVCRSLKDSVLPRLPLKTHYLDVDENEEVAMVVGLDSYMHWSL